MRRSSKGRRPLGFMAALALALAAWGQDEPQPPPAAPPPEAPPGERVSFFGNSMLDADEAATEYVTMFGNSQAKGVVEREYVTIFGNSWLAESGSVGREYVTIMGNARVDGTVGSEVVVVMGNLSLGPSADVEKAVVVGGILQRDEGAVVRGPVEEVPIPIVSSMLDWDALHAYLAAGPGMGRLIVPSMAGTWALAGICLAMVAVFALLFARPVNACIETLETKPGHSLLAAFGFALVGGPLISVIMLILVATVVGLLAMPFVFVACIFLVALSFATVYGLAGRRLGLGQSACMSVAVGGAALSLFYLVPVAGLLAFVSFGFVGVGAAIVACLQHFGQIAPAANASQAAKAVQARREYEALGRQEELGLEDQGLAGSSVGYRPVGFGPRLAAAVIDLLVVGVSINAVFGTMDSFLFFWLVYHVSFWSWKGTTLGGAALRLRVEMISGEKVSLGSCIARALASVLSFACLGLGFFWASWDVARQSWHDKIAGTVIVKAAKGERLL